MKEQEEESTTNKEHRRGEQFFFKLRDANNYLIKAKYNMELNILGNLY